MTLPVIKEVDPRELIALFFLGSTMTCTIYQLSPSKHQQK
jgi:hypothetical protein